jgi:hypothetical protein
LLELGVAFMWEPLFTEVRRTPFNIKRNPKNFPVKIMVTFIIVNMSRT